MTAGEHPGRAAAQPARVDPGSLQRLPRQLQQHAAAADPSPAPRAAPSRRTPRRTPRRRRRTPRCACTTCRRTSGSGSNRPARSQPRSAGNSDITSRPSATICHRPSGLSTPPGNRHDIPTIAIGSLTAPAAHGWCASGVQPGPALSAAPRSHAGVDQPSTSSNPRLTLAVAVRRNAALAESRKLTARIHIAALRQPQFDRVVPARRCQESSPSARQLRGVSNTSDTPGFHAEQ